MDKQKLFLKKIKCEKRNILLIQFIIIFLIIFIWEYLSEKNIINPFIYSSPLNIIKTIKELYLTHNLFIHIFTTLKEIIIAFLSGTILGFIIAIILYEFPKVAKILDPFLTVLNSLPKVALGPIIIIIIGANTKSIIIMALLINLIISIITIYSGFLNTDKIKVKLFKTFNASKKDILFKLIIPSSYQNIISSLKLNISLSLIGLLPPVGEKTFFNKCYSRY